MENRALVSSSSAISIDMKAEQPSATDPLRILLVSTSDGGGGAEQSAWNLLHAYTQQGCETSLAVGNKRTDDPHVLTIPNHASRNLWAKVWLGVAGRLRQLKANKQAVDWLARFCSRIGEPRRWSERDLGYEDFYYPGTERLLQLSERPDILHCFNLHGGYFDLRALKQLSRQLPVILDLRDGWLLSGHCAHSLDCERWKIGCGSCPYLTVPVRIRKDATAYNWSRKREIYAASRIYVSTPCRWLMNKVEQSMLAPAVIESRVIPTGVDLSVFRKADRRAARAALNLSPDGIILLFTANGVRRNVWKDYKTLETAISLVGTRLKRRDVRLIALGENGASQRIGEIEVQFVPYQKSSHEVARYYQAADVYVHAARADTFPRTVLEALACGTPVVATAVCGIPEQIKSLNIAPSRCSMIQADTYDSDRATGVLVKEADAQALATAILELVNNDLLRAQLSQNAINDAELRFDLQDQARRYLDWYRELLRKREFDRQQNGFQWH